MRNGFFTNNKNENQCCNLLTRFEILVLKCEILCDKIFKITRGGVVSKEMPRKMRSYGVRLEEPGFARICNSDFRGTGHCRQRIREIPEGFFEGHPARSTGNPEGSLYGQLASLIRKETE